MCAHFIKNLIMLTLPKNIAVKIRSLRFKLVGISRLNHIFRRVLDSDPIIFQLF